MPRPKLASAQGSMVSLGNEQGSSVPADFQQQERLETRIQHRYGSLGVEEEHASLSSEITVHVKEGPAQEAAPEDAEIRGMCGYCKHPVFVTQERGKDPATGDYYHSECGKKMYPNYSMTHPPAVAPTQILRLTTLP